MFLCGMCVSKNKNYESVSDDYKIDMRLQKLNLIVQASKGVGRERDNVFYINVRVLPV